MKILLSYASEFDKGEGVHFARVLRRLGHEVREINVAANAMGSGSPGRVVVGYPADVRIERLVEDAGGADLFLYIEPGGLIPIGLEASPVPTACILSDVHRNLSARRVLARLFDRVFVYQPNYIAAFDEHEPEHVAWLPYACDTELFADRRIPRDLDVAFVGRLYTAPRREMIEALAARFAMNEQRYYLQQEIPAIYSRARIVVDLPVADDIPFRVFEAMSCGAMLVARRSGSGLHRLFTDGVHFASYTSKRDLVERVDYYLRHNEEREAIAANGHAEILRAHRLEHRANRVLAGAAGGPGGAPIRRAVRAAVARTYAAVLERSGRVEALLKLAAAADTRARDRFSFRHAAVRSCVRRMVLGW